ncbi:hypothetical protein DV736_g4108, partial [Chaetothyriales sp. CBS 134916]
MTDTTRPSSNTGQPALASQPSIIDGGVQSLPPLQDNHGGQSDATTLEKWSRTPRPRGRQAKDPMGIEVRYQCASIENMEAQLHDYIANPTGPPEHTTLEFAFPTSAAFMISTSGPTTVKDGGKTNSAAFPSFSRTAVSIIDALSQGDPKEQLRKQKAIAKAIVDCISCVDGYRYSFHNSWVSKEDEALRFSYFCNDSILNKGRAANEGAGMAGKKKVKPVYDCRGVIHIKFSATKQVLEVHYRHMPLHQTYEARAPPPRKGSKRRKFLELFAPEKLPKHNTNSRSRLVNESREPTEPRPRKSRRPTDPPSDAAGDHALAPLIDFLDSAQREGDQTLEVNGDSQQPSSSELQAHSIDRVDPTKSHGKDKRPRPSLRASSIPSQGRAKPSNIPGTMAGYLVGNDLEIEWAFDQDKPTQREVHHTGALQGIAGTATTVAKESAPLPEQASELDILKQKLLEAEQRIQRLEAEKQRPMGPPGWPSSARPQSNPQSYAYPYQAFGQSPQQHQQPQGYPSPAQYQYSQQPPAETSQRSMQPVATLPYYVDQNRQHAGQSTGRAE